MTEKTLILIKPDAVSRNLIGEIISIYEKKGLKIIALKMLQMDETLTKTHYQDHINKPFFPGLQDYITSSPLIALVLEGIEAIKVARSINGATNPKEAALGTIRGSFAMSKQFNLVHASDSPESSAREIDIFFNNSEIFSYNTPNYDWFQE